MAVNLASSVFYCMWCKQGPVCGAGCEPGGNCMTIYTINADFPGLVRDCPKLKVCFAPDGGAVCGLTSSVQSVSAVL